MAWTSIMFDRDRQKKMFGNMLTCGLYMNKKNIYVWSIMWFTFERIVVRYLNSSEQWMLVWPCWNFHSEPALIKSLFFLRGKTTFTHVMTQWIVETWWIMTWNVFFFLLSVNFMVIKFHFFYDNNFVKSKKKNCEYWNSFIPDACQALFNPFLTCLNDF